MGNVYGVDLGTCNVKFVSKANGEIVKEKNAIAIRNKNEYFAAGDEAYAMFEKSPTNIKVTFPVVNGVIADYKNMQVLIATFMERHYGAKGKGADYIIAVPTDITEVEKKSFFDLFYKSKLKPKNVLLCEKPIAAAVGLGINVNEPTGVLVADIGADTTEISVLSLSGLVSFDLMHLGGNRLDESIISFVRNKYSLIIGQKTAMNLKMEIGDAMGEDLGKRVIVGRDVISGLPIELEISSSDINEAIQSGLEAICNSLKGVLEKTPPELSKDIVKNGIYLTGGGASLQHLAELIKEATNISVNVMKDPGDCVVKGLNKIVSDEAYHSLAYSLKKRIYS